jgi:hypothetical protein
VSFIDQVLAARRVAPQEKLFNTPTGIRRDPNLLATGVVRPQVREGLLSQGRQSNRIPEFARPNAESGASLTEAWKWSKEKVENVLDKISGKEEDRVSQVETELSSKGYSNEVIASILGNIDVETDGSFDSQQKQYKGGPGRGLLQMEGKMLTAYQKYLNDNKKQDSTKQQVHFMSEILTDDKLYDIGAGHRKELKKTFATGNVDLITKEISDRLLRPGIPHMKDRIASARKYYRP